MTDSKKGWLAEGLREVQQEATPEMRQRVADHPSGFAAPASAFRDTTPLEKFIALLHEEGGSVALIAATYAAGINRGLELAKEHAEAVVVFECGECDGEGRVDDENSSGDVECSKCEGSGTVTHRQKTIDFTAADAAVEREAK